MVAPTAAHPQNTQLQVQSTQIQSTPTESCCCSWWCSAKVLPSNSIVISQVAQDALPTSAVEATLPPDPDQHGRYPLPQHPQADLKLNSPLYQKRKSLPQEGSVSGQHSLASPSTTVALAKPSSNTMERADASSSATAN